MKNLQKILQQFKENGWKGTYTAKEWKIADGAYDLDFKIYFNNEPVADCILGELSVWGNIEEEFIKTVVDILEIEEPAKCEWCGEYVAEEELISTSIGNICERCKQAIESRGEEVWK